MSMKSRYSMALVLFLFVSLWAPLSAQERDLDELLGLSLEELSSIEIISASKTYRKVNEVPATVRVITSEQIRANGYQTLEDALADQPGMQFRNINGYNSYVFMRGVPSQNNLILVLIDGVQINELNSGGFYGGGQYNLSNVERIEIVYGPASALYGTNAVSGIINIITKKPQEYEGPQLSARIGSFNTLQTNLSYGYWDAEKQLGCRISGSYQTTRKTDLAGQAGDHNWTEDLENFEDDYALDVRLGWQKFRAGLNYLHKQSSAATKNKSVGTIYRDSDTFWNIRFLNAYLSHATQLSEKAGLRSRAYFRETTVLPNSVLVVTDTAQIGYYRPNHLIGFEGLVNYDANPRMNLVGGIVLESEKLAQGYSNSYSSDPDTRPPEPSKPAMQRNTLLSAFGQLSAAPVQPLEFFAGARFDHSSVYEKVWTPRLGVVYNRSRLTAKLLYMEAFRAPRPWDYTDGLGNPDLKPEEMRSLELYTAYDLMPGLRLGASLYRNRLANRFVKAYLDEAQWRWINYGHLNTTGFELSAEYRKNAMQSYCNYTFNRSVDEDDSMIPEISEHQLNAGIQYRFSQKLYCSLRGNYLGRRKNTRVIASTGSEFVDAAFVLHVAVTYSVAKKIALQLAVNNLLDAEYYHSSNLSPDRYRQPQRALFVSIAYR